MNTDNGDDDWQWRRKMFDIVDGGWGGGRGASSQNNRGAAAWHSDLSPKFQGVEIEIR